METANQDSRKFPRLGIPVERLHGIYEPHQLAVWWSMGYLPVSSAVMKGFDPY
jgi:hypothetical protein